MIKIAEKKFEKIIEAQGKEFRTAKEFFSFDGNAQKGDYVYIKDVVDNDNFVVDLKITDMGLNSSWTSTKYKVEFFDKKKKKLESQVFNKSDQLFKFLKINNIPF